MSVALDQAFYSALLADTGTGGVNEPDNGATAGFHNPVAPREINGSPVGFPRVHFSELINTAIYSFANLNADHVYYQITVYAKDSPLYEGVSKVKRLAERVRVLLTDASFPVLNDGTEVLYCRFERTLPLTAEWDETNKNYVYGQGMIFEVWNQ